MKQLVLTNAFLLVFQCVYTQFNWVNSYGGNYVDRGHSIAVDKDGYIYSSGVFSNTASFDTIQLQSLGDFDIYLCKQDSLGNVIWCQGFGGVGNDYVRDIAIDSNSNIYLCGRFQHTLAVDSIYITSPDTIDSDIFVCKFNPNGNVLWAKGFGGNSTDEAMGITTDGLGSVYITGHYYRTTTLGTVTLVSQNNSSDIFVAGLEDASGNVIWAESAGGASWDRGSRIAWSNSTGKPIVYITGCFSNVAYFGNSTLSSSSTHQYFVAAFGAELGGVVWASGGGTGFSEGKDLKIDSKGNIITTGWFRNAITIQGNNLSNTGADDIFIARYDKTGSLLWLKGTSCSSYSSGNGLAIDGADNIYITGHFRGAINTGLTMLISASSGAYDILFLNYDSSGTPLNSFKAGAPSSINDIGFDIAIDTISGNVYATGNHSNNAMFGGINVTGNNGGNAYVTRLFSSATVSIDETTQIDNSVLLYPNPTTGEFNVISSTNINKMMIINSLGELVGEYLPINGDMSLSHLPTGVYFCTIRLKGNTSLIEKIVLY